MVTSRETRRWVLPKGWLSSGKKPWKDAQIEALEEAGVVGKIHEKPIGTCHYVKRLPRGETCRCKVLVFPLLVERLEKDWKERKERSRRWFSPKKAARLVEERDLATLLEKLAGDCGTHLIPKKLRKVS